MTRIHWIKTVDGSRFPAEGTTYCGKVGSSEGSDEWTTYDGHESRFEAIHTSRGVTCKTCLKASERLRDGDGSGPPRPSSPPAHKMIA